MAPLEAAEAVRVPAGHHAASRGRADRRGRVEAVEPQARAGHLVEVRRLACGCQLRRPSPWSSAMTSTILGALRAPRRPAASAPFKPARHNPAPAAFKTHDDSSACHHSFRDLSLLAASTDYSHARPAAPQHTPSRLTFRPRIAVAPSPRISCFVSRISFSANRACTEASVKLAISSRCVT